MPTKSEVSERVKPERLRFRNAKGARAYIKVNKLKVTEQVSTRRGDRINVVDGNGRARTLTVEKPA